MDASSSSFRARVCAIGPAFWFVAKGLAHDYWKDGKAFLRASSALNPKSHAPTQASSQGSDSTNPAFGRVVSLWTADRSQILQKMWGNGFSLPGGNVLTDLLMTPVGLTNEKSVLDLTAGLGGLGRKVATDYGTYVTGLEEDRSLVPIGMMMSLAAGRSKQASIEAYVPSSFQTTKSFDCIVARELFYRLADKDAFFDAMVKALKPKGHVVFTDYLLEPDKASAPEVRDWLATEGGVSPLSLEAMRAVWAKRKFDVRINEDLTSQYKKEILTGLMRFSTFLATKKPDLPTKQMIMKELEAWAHRVAAMEQGAKLYRFHVIKR